jgi:heptosyltransferase-2
MATPTLRLLRDALPGAFIGALARPSIAELLAGTPLLDEFVVERVSGAMGHKHAAAKLRALRFDAALLLTNSFSTALATRMAGIAVRVGYSRDGRGPLLTHRLRAPEWPGSTALRRRWAPVSAVAYYYAAGRALLGDPPPPFEELDEPMSVLPSAARLELPVSDADRAAAAAVLERVGVRPDEPLAVLNPGANNPAKRWPAERFGRLAAWLETDMGLRVAVNAGPGEEELARSVCAAAGACGVTGVVSLAGNGQTLAALKAILERAKLLITNDTGPRHLAAALGTPTVALFGPTDPRWTTLPGDPGREAILSAGDLGADRLDPTELADEHPHRCRMDKIPEESVCAAARRLLGPGATPGSPPGSGSQPIQPIS